MSRESTPPSKRRKVDPDLYTISTTPDKELFPQNQILYEYEPSESLDQEILILGEEEPPILKIKPNQSKCFNCSSYEHSLSNCPFPRNPDIIKHNRQEFNEGKGALGDLHREGKLSDNRKTDRNYELFKAFSPGVISEDLRLALGSSTNSANGLIEWPWYEGFLRWGYPPGYFVAVDEPTPFQRLERQFKADYWEESPILAIYDDESALLVEDASTTPLPPETSPPPLPPEPQPEKQYSRIVDYPSNILISSNLPPYSHIYAHQERNYSVTSAVYKTRSPSPELNSDMDLENSD